MYTRNRAVRVGGAFAAATAACVALTVMPLSLASATTSSTVVVDGMILNDDGRAVINDLEQAEIAPGLTHVGYEMLSENGWQQVNILKAELSDETVKMKYLTPDTVAGSGATVTEMTDAAGAIGGVNLDRFDINNSSAAAGWGVSDGEIIKSGNPNEAEASIGMTSDGLGTLVDLYLEGSVSFADQTSVQLTGINVFHASGAVLYNSSWGSYSRTAGWVGDAASGIEVWIGADGTVQQVSESVGEGEIPEGVQVIVARDDSVEASRLRQLEVGDEATVSYGIRDDIDVEEAGGAWFRLVQDGRIVETSEPYLNTDNPRTMLGFSEDRRTAFFVVVDGRQANAKGMQYRQMSELMLDLGAYNAINADGGGSTQMNVRYPGDASSTIVNSPSDGFERRDGDGMGLVLARPGSGEVTGFRLEPTLADDHGLRVFPGLHRTVGGYAHDESNTSVDAAVSEWSTGDTQLATVAAEGSVAVVAGQSAGATTLAAANGAASGSLELTVLGALTQLSTDQTTINLEAQGSQSTVTVTGHDAEGFTAPVEARDLTVTNSNESVFSVVPTADGRFDITAIGETGSAIIGFEAAGVRTELAVAVPLELTLIDDFSSIDGWSTAHDRAPEGGIEAGEGHDGSPSIRLNYDFTDSTATRGRYAVAPGAPGNGETGGIEIPGRPQKLSVWVKGDGNGSLLRLQVMQANGVRNWIDGPGGLYVTWTGWQRVDFVVPESFEFPLKLERIRALETVAVKQYSGSLEFSKIYAYLPPEGVQSPEVDVPEDESVVAAGETDDEPLRIAVVSDAQFVARDPESVQIQGARKALSEIADAEPDLMILNGDFVDEASVDDFDLAQQILDEELGDVDFPWYYVPGNHEIMGADLSNFTNAFGDSYASVDIEGTRIIMLNSATGKLFSQFDQIQLLRERLDDASTNPEITGVLVFSHMPTNDPLPTKSSQLSDRNEAELVDDWLQEFRASSGKSAGYIGSHSGVFDATTEEGVSYVVNGNSGKDPASSPDAGGFTGWTMLGVDPAAGEWAASGERWLEVETRPRVDADGLSLLAPETITLDDTAEVSAEFAQDQEYDGRVVPVAWPVSAAWGGSGVHVGAADAAPAEAVIAYADGVVTALRAGTATLSVTVNGQTAEQEIVVEAQEFDLPTSGLTVTGLPQVGGELTVTQTWSLPEDAEVGFQWLRDGEPIPGAVSERYTVTAEDHQSVLSVVATVTARGYDAGVQRSNGVEIGDGELVLVVAPTLTGEAVVGGTLQVTDAEWQVDTSQVIVWTRDGATISGVEGSTYQLTAADSGTEIRAIVTAAAQGYGTATAMTAAVSVAAVDDAPAGVDATEQQASGKELSTTGGTLPVLLLVVGAGLLATGAVMFVMRRRRESDAE